MSDLQIATIDAIVGVFEGGRPFKYEAVARAKSDPGGLSFGKHQVSHTSGNLYGLLASYVSWPGADPELSSQVKEALPRLKAPKPLADKDKEKARMASIDGQRLALMADNALRDLLVATGSDKAMKAAQDQYFLDNYLTPALKKWRELGFVHALSAAVAYDSKIQSGTPFRPDQKEAADGRAGPASAANEKEWINAYVDARREWLSQSGSEAVRASVYRMDALKALIRAGNWELALPLTVNGYELTVWDDFPEHAFEDPFRRTGFENFGALHPDPKKWTGRGRYVNTALVVAQAMKRRPSDALGRFDDASVAALKSFQQSCGLPASGGVDGDTFAKLAENLETGEHPPATTADGLKRLPPEQKTTAPVGSTVGGAVAVGVAGAGAAISAGGANDTPTPSPAPPPAPAQTTKDAPANADQPAQGASGGAAASPGQPAPAGAAQPSAPSASADAAPGAHAGSEGAPAAADKAPSPATTPDIAAKATPAATQAGTLQPAHHPGTGFDIVHLESILAALSFVAAVCLIALARRRWT